jgi:hypothetical protein
MKTQFSNELGANLWIHPRPRDAGIAVSENHRIFFLSGAELLA